MYNVNYNGNLWPKCIIDIVWRTGGSQILIILIDMDNVVADLYTKWLAVYNLEYNDNLTAEQVITWNIDSYARKCSVDQFNAIVERAGFFADLMVIPDAVEVTQRLQKAGHDLWFVTATPYENPTGGFDKIRWVNNHFPHIGKSHVIQSHHKNMIKGDILFDDGPDNLVSFPGIKVAMHYPHNDNIRVDHRANNWLEFEKIVYAISADK